MSEIEERLQRLERRNRWLNIILPDDHVERPRCTAQGFRGQWVSLRDPRRPSIL